MKSRTCVIIYIYIYIIYTIVFYSLERALAPERGVSVVFGEAGVGESKQIQPCPLPHLYTSLFSFI